MKRIISDIKKAVCGQSYITDFSQRKFLPSVGFLSTLSLIHGVIFLIIMLLGSAAALHFFSGVEARDFIKKYIPAGVEVVVKDGVVTTGDNQPIVIPIPEEEQKQKKKKKHKKEKEDEWVDFKNLLVVNASVSNQLQAFEKYKTVALVTSEKIVIAEGEGETKVIDVDVLPNMTINQENILEKYDLFIPFIKVAIFVLPLLVWPFFAFGLVVYYLFLTLVLALIFLVVAGLKKVRVSYKQAYIISLYGLTGPILLSILGSLFGLDIGTVVTVLVYIIMVMINFGEVKKKEKKK